MRLDLSPDRVKRLAMIDIDSHGNVLTGSGHVSYDGRMSEMYREVVPEWTTGDRLRKARERVGLKQTELAAEIGIGRSSVVNYELDRASPPRPVLLAWSLRTGVSYEWLSGNAGQGIRTRMTLILPRSQTWRAA